LMCHINKFKDSNLRSSWLKFAPVERLIEGKILELNGANRLEKLSRKILTKYQEY